MTKTALDLSIIIPVYNEEANILPLVARIKASLDPQNIAYEVLFIDDGSKDQTFEQVRVIHGQDARFKGIRLKQNMGKAEVYMAGFSVARGTLVATMDGDLQDNPEDLLKLIEAMKHGADMVIGWKKTGKSSLFTYYLSRFFNKGIRWLTQTSLHDLNCPLRVMSREVAQSLYIYASLHRYIPLLVTSQGYKVREIEVGNSKRLYGTSHYGYAKYLESLFDLMTVLFVTYYRKRPLQFLGPIGLFSFTMGFLIDGYYCLLGLTDIEPMRRNIPSLMLGVMLIMIGVQIILTGLIGEMISRELGVDRNDSLPFIGELVGIDLPKKIGH